MKKVKVLGLIASLLVFAFCISSCKQSGAGGIESSGKKEVTFSIEQKDLVNKSTKSATIKADAKYVVVSIANDVGLVYDTKRLDLYNFSGSFISEPISLDIATTPYKVTKFLVLDANNVVIYATPLEGSALAPMVDDPLPINFTVSKDLVTKVVPQVLATESIPVKDFGYVAFDFDVMASPLYFRTCVQIYNPATANWMLTTADITITGTPGDVALYNNPIAAITDIVRVSDGYTNYKISVSKTGYATKEILLTNAQLKTYMENPLIVLLIEPGVVVPNGYGLLYNWYTTQPQGQVKFGYLYNWYAATDARGIYASNAHVPSKTEWESLLNSIDVFSEEDQRWPLAGVKLRESSFNHWSDGDGAIIGTNEYRFAARGSSSRDWGGNFGTGKAGIKIKCSFVTSTMQENNNCWYVEIGYNSTDVAIGIHDLLYGVSVRLIIDTPIEINGNNAIYVGNDLRRYKCVLINSVWWLAENLMETRYRNGDLIPIVTDDTEWSALITGARCSYNNDESNAVTTVSIAPAGWHVPTQADAIALGNHFGAYPWNNAGGYLKESGLLHWTTPNVGADNSSGFNGRGSGIRQDGVYVNKKIVAQFYTSTLTTTGAYVFFLSNINAQLGVGWYNSSTEQLTKTTGFSIRLIKDDSTDPGTLTDIDGNVYQTVKIGNQVWTASNWKCTKYNDGTAIPNVTDNAAWAALTTGAWCVYDNDINNK